MYSAFICHNCPSVDKSKLNTVPETAFSHVGGKKKLGVDPAQIGFTARLGVTTGGHDGLL